MYIPHIHNSHSLKESQIFTLKKKLFIHVKTLENLRQNIMIIPSDLLVKYNLVLSVLSIISTRGRILLLLLLSNFRLATAENYTHLLICKCLLHFVIRCPYSQNTSLSMESPHTVMYSS